MLVKEGERGPYCDEKSETVDLKEVTVNQKYPIPGTKFYSCPSCRNSDSMGAECAFRGGSICRLNNKKEVILPLT